VRHSRIVRGVLLGSALASAAFSSVVTAQQSAPTPRPPVPLKVEVVLSRWQADKKIASVPFTLWPVSNSPRGNYVNLRVGVSVPVGTATVTRGSASPNQTSSTSTTSTSVEYRNIGTSIDCVAYPAGDAAGFNVELRISDSSMFTDQSAAGTLRFNDRAPFRTFDLSHTMAVRDGQTVQFASATDKLTGETLKVDVTVNVVK